MEFSDSTGASRQRAIPVPLNGTAADRVSLGFRHQRITVFLFARVRLCSLHLFMLLPGFNGLEQRQAANSADFASSWNLARLEMLEPRCFGASADPSRSVRAISVMMEAASCAMPPSRCARAEMDLPRHCRKGRPSIVFTFPPRSQL